MGRPIAAVIFDLDGLILDTESLCLDVGRQVLARHGATLTKEAAAVALGKRPLECWADVARVLGLAVPAQQLLDESEPLLQARWADAKLLPGALRLLRHLARHGVPLALATSTPRATLLDKLSLKEELRELLLPLAVCGDEVSQGKPHPEVFLAAAARLGVPPAQCLVFEDAPSGVAAATAAGMRVVVVPSLVDRQEYPQPDAAAAAGPVQVLPSLLAFEPAALGLQPFSDLLHGVVPLDAPIYISGTVVRGFGRGSKELGIPTANVDGESLRAALAEAVTGIYAGWASLGQSLTVYPMVMSIGFNPHYGNSDKTAEPWLLHTFEQAFYGESIRLVVCGYVRPEAAFTSLAALVERIHEDGAVSRRALDLQPLAGYAADPFLGPSGAAAEPGR